VTSYLAFYLPLNIVLYTAQQSIFILNEQCTVISQHGTIFYELVPQCQQVFRNTPFPCILEDGWGNLGEIVTFQIPIEKNRVQIFGCLLPVSSFLDMHLLLANNFRVQFYINFIKNLCLKVNLQLDIKKYRSVTF